VVSRFTAGLVQMTSSTDVAENVAVASRLIREAAAAGADLVATPEMTTLLERSRRKALAGAAGEADDRALPAFRALAAELSVHLLIGSIPIRIAGEMLANRCFLIGPDGAICARYDKIHMFDVELGSGESYRESGTYRPGREAVVAGTPLARFGLSVCYDVRFGYLYRSLAKAGAQVLSVPAAFTKVTGEAGHWHTLLRARAIETGCYVIAPAQVGDHADGRSTYGHSLAVAPWGEIVADGGTETGVALAEIDLGAIDRARGRVPAIEHDRPYETIRVAPAAARETEFEI